MPRVKVERFGTRHIEGMQACGPFGARGTMSAEKATQRATFSEKHWATDKTNIYEFVMLCTTDTAGNTYRIFGRVAFLANRNGGLKMNYGVSDECGDDLAVIGILCALEEMAKLLPWHVVISYATDAQRLGRCGFHNILDCAFFGQGAYRAKLWKQLAFPAALYGIVGVAQGFTVFPADHQRRFPVHNHTIVTMKRLPATWHIPTMVALMIKSRRLRLRQPSSEIWRLVYDFIT